MKRGMLKGRFLFTAGIVGVLSSGVASRADVDYEREWNPYVTLRGGWLFGGKAKYNSDFYGDPGGGVVHVNSDRKESLKSAWSGSVEFGCSCCEDRVLVGLELGCFAGKAKYEFDDAEKARHQIGGVAYFDSVGAPSYAVLDGKYKNLFAAVNVALKKDVGERVFLYGGVGAGVARSDFGELNWRYHEYNIPPGVGDANAVEKIDFKAKWRLLTQAFASFGVYLNENWSLTAGYRLRYLPGDCKGSKKFAHDRVTWDWKVKQNILHAAEIGLTYQF